MQIMNVNAISGSSLTCDIGTAIRMSRRMEAMKRRAREGRSKRHKNIGEILVLWVMPLFRQSIACRNNFGAAPPLHA